MAKTGSGRLTISFIGDSTTLSPGESLRFGRQGDVVIDDNPFLHRVVGRFTFREGFWWLQNHGSRTELTLIDVTHGARTTIRPGQQVPIVPESFVVSFSAGPTTYELEGEHDMVQFALDDSGVPVGTATIDFGIVPLSDEQHLILVALAEHRLLGVQSMPTNQAIASRLGWTITKYNRKLDAVCN